MLLFWGRTKEEQKLFIYLFISVMKRAAKRIV